MKNKPIYHSPDHDISLLGLSTHCQNSLKRAGIVSVDDLIAANQSGVLPDIYGLGQKHLSEIEELLAQIVLAVDAPDKKANESLDKIIKWERKIIDHQISIGLLHSNAKIFDKSLADWLQLLSISDRNTSAEFLIAIIGYSVNICQEIEYLLKELSPNYLEVLLLRHGYQSLTLEQIGKELSVTRERIRQISTNTKEKLRRAALGIVNSHTPIELGEKPGLVKIQTALLIAKDMDLDITYHKWKNYLYSSGIVGNWQTDSYSDIDPLEALYAICNLLAEYKIPELEIPINLGYILGPTAIDTPDIPARTIHSIKNLSKELLKEIKRHTQFIGSVNVNWLAREQEKNVDYLSDLLVALDYQPFTKEWFIPRIETTGDDEDAGLDKNQCLQNSLQKMYQYCGPLSIEDICGGLEHAVSRTNYPVPPPEVMAAVLQVMGYQCENGLYSSPIKTNVELSGGEEIIFACFSQYGRVVHHAELAQAFIDSELSFPSLHKTLDRSPLFERLEKALYKIRGQKIDNEDIERATKVGNKIPVNPEIEYDNSGKIIVRVTLGILAIATGSIFSEQLPNMSGDWLCYVNGRQLGTLTAVENEFRHIQKPIESLHCVVGTRLQLVFNIWDRSVTIEAL